MFGLGFGEVLVILVVVLLVFGPEKLPEIARTLGKTMADFRRSVDDIKHELTVPRLDDPPVPAPAPAASAAEESAAVNTTPPPDRSDPCTSCDEHDHEKKPA